MCAKHGFEVIGLHEPSLVSDGLGLLLDEVRSRCDIFGAKFVTTWFGHDRPSSYDAYSGYADLCLKAGTVLRQDGIVLCYHCYDFDLKPLGKNCEDKSGIDVLVEKTAAEDLSFELDTYFLYKAQCSLEAALGKYGHRCKLVHVDDIDEKRLHAPLGAGLIPWAEVIKPILETCSVERFILEHESPYALKWIVQSIRYWEEIIVPIIKELARNGGGRNGKNLSQ
jgi:sugar phosphate isomerase/epimerase